MKALMVHSEDSAVGAYRIWQPAKHLPSLGWEVKRLPNQTPTLPNDRSIGQTSKDPEIRRAYEKYGSWEDMAEDVDIMVIQRSDNPQTIALALAIRDVYNIPIVYEIDDNIFDVSENSPSYQYWFPGSPLFEVAELFLKNVDAITTTTPALAEVFRQYNDNVYVLPNSQDPDDWAGQATQPKSDQVVIGWAGGHSHYDDLKAIAPAIKKILKKHNNVIFRVIGTLPDFLENVKGVEFRTDAVHASRWPSKLAELNFDIGLAPVVNRPFNRGKSNIKWQEYSMLEIPTIASSIGTYDAIEHMRTGILTNNDPKEWLKAIDLLVTNPYLRKSLGQEAKRSVMDQFNITENIHLWDAAYREIIERKKKNTKE